MDTAGTRKYHDTTQKPETHRDTLYTHIHFRQGYSLLDSTFADNNIRLKKLVTLLDSIVSTPLASIKSVTIKGTASPEGTSLINHRLSEKRAQNARTYILDHTSLTDSLVRTVPADVDWEMLSELVAVTDKPWRDEVLDIIASPDKNTTKNKTGSGRIRRLQALHKGKVWADLMRNIFPVMRNARYYIIYEWETIPSATIERTETNTTPDTTSVTDDNLQEPTITIIPEERNRKKFTILLKTNMLYDAVLTPNLAVEIPIGDRLSIEADWMYARWNKHSAHKYWRIYGGDFTVYTRLGNPNKARDRYAGHFIGAYGSTAVYDFQFGNHKGVLSDKWNYAAGIAYKYSMPVARRLYLEGSIGIGYLWGTYKKHRPIDECDVWLSTHRLGWLGPTRAGISIVWLIGNAEKARIKKGGNGL